MQCGNLLATRTRHLSIFVSNPFDIHSPTRNLWILPAMLASLAFLFFFSYVPFFQNTFLTRVNRSEHRVAKDAWELIEMMYREYRLNTSSFRLHLPLGSCFSMKVESTLCGPIQRVYWLVSLGRRVSFNGHWIQTICIVVIIHENPRHDQNFSTRIRSPTIQDDYFPSTLDLTCHFTKLWQIHQM